MAYVKINDKEDFEKQLKKFSKMVRNEKILEEVRSRKYFSPKSVKKRQALKESKLTQFKRNNPIKKKKY